MKETEMRFKLKHFDHHHSSGNETDDCKYICIVLNNEVYPCGDRKRSYGSAFTSFLLLGAGHMV